MRGFPTCARKTTRFFPAHEGPSKTPPETYASCSAHEGPSTSCQTKTHASFSANEGPSKSCPETYAMSEKTLMVEPGPQVPNDSPDQLAVRSVGPLRGGVIRSWLRRICKAFWVLRSSGAQGRVWWRALDAPLLGFLRFSTASRPTGLVLCGTLIPVGSWIPMAWLPMDLHSFRIHLAPDTVPHT